MLAAVPAERVGEQGLSVAGGEVGLQVVAGDPGRRAADDDAVAELVEDLGDAGLQGLVVGAAVEGDPDVAVVEVGGIARQAPGHAAGLVVQGGVQVPGPGGLVLQAALVLAWRRERRVPGGAADDLDGPAVAHGRGLQQRAEVVGRLFGRDLLPRSGGIDLGPRLPRAVFPGGR